MARDDLRVDGRAPCVVSDRVMYRTLLRSGLDRYEEVVRAVRVGSTRGSTFHEKVWKLVVRYQQMEADGRTCCTLLGADASDYQEFRRLVRENLPQEDVRDAILKVFPRKLRQLRRDLRQADDFDFFCCGGLNLRDEIEFVLMYIERTFRHLQGVGTALRELELLDFQLRHRLNAFLVSEDAACAVGPDDGFRLAPGAVPDRFWWRFLAPSRRGGPRFQDPELDPVREGGPGGHGAGTPPRTRRDDGSE